MTRPITLLGIDLSSLNLSRRGKTCAVWAELDNSGTLLFTAAEKIEGDCQLLNLLVESEYLLCAIDAPLSLPPCVICRNWQCQKCPILRVSRELRFSQEHLFHFRLSDLVVKSANLGIVPKPALSNGGPVDITPLTMRWQRIARQLSKEGTILEKIFEVYSRGVALLLSRYLELPLPGKGKKPFHRQNFFQKLVLNFPIKIPPEIANRLILNEDFFDASVACLSLWFMLREEYYLPEEILIQTELAEPLHRLARELLYQFPWPVYPNFLHE